MIGIKYEDRGVSPDKPEVEEAIKDADRGIFLGCFCHVSPDIFLGDPEYCTIMHADGVGTKSAIAMLVHRESGRYEAFDGLAQDSLVMNTDDMLCAGAVGPFLVSNTIGRNAKAFDGRMLRRVIGGYHEFGRNMDQFGIKFEFCGGETADLGDLVRTVVIDSTISIRMPRARIVNAANVCAGQAIVGLASFGRATYERNENSGIGTNGFTAARHELLKASYRKLGADTFDASLGDKAYTGKYSLSDTLPNGGGMTIGEALLSPTRTYLPIMARALRDGHGKISAMFHNTGGGLTKCLKFGNHIKYVKDALFEAPPIFQAIAENGGMAPSEMLRVFNLGQRFEVVCDHDFAKDLVEISRSFGVDARVIGHTEETGDGVKLEIAAFGSVHKFART